MATNPLAPDPFVIGGTERRLPAAATPTFMPPATASNAPAPINTPQTGGLSYAERARIERLQPQVYGGNIGLTAPQPTGSTPAAPGFVIGGSVPGSPTPPSPTANGPSGSTAGSGNSYAANFGQGVLAQQTADAGVNPNSLVSTRLNALIDKDSEYMQLAKTRALQEMNARGLQNSSIAIGAGQAAAIEAARPIAEGDAAVYANNERDRQRGVLDKQARAEEYSFRASDAAAERLYRSQEAVAERQARAQEALGANNLALRNVPAQFATNVQTKLSDDIAAVIRDPAITAANKEQIISNLTNNSRATLDWASAYYGNSGSGLLSSGAPQAPATNAPRPVEPDRRVGTPSAPFTFTESPPAPSVGNTPTSGDTQAERQRKYLEFLATRQFMG